MSNANAPAYPILLHEGEALPGGVEPNGMTKREHFAAMAPHAPAGFPWPNKPLGPVHPYHNPRRRPELPSDPVVKGRLQQWLADGADADPCSFCDDLTNAQQAIAEKWEAEFMAAVEQFEADHMEYQQRSHALRQARWAVEYADALLAELERTS